MGEMGIWIPDAWRRRTESCWSFTTITTRSARKGASTLALLRLFSPSWKTYLTRYTVQTALGRSMRHKKAWFEKNLRCGGLRLCKHLADTTLARRSIMVHFRESRMYRGAAEITFYVCHGRLATCVSQASWLIHDHCNTRFSSGRANSADRSACQRWPLWLTTHISLNPSTCASRPKKIKDMRTNDSQSSLRKSFDRFEELILRHSVDRPPWTTGVLNPQDIDAITDYVTTRCVEIQNIP